MRVLVLGARGMLGSDLVMALRKRGHGVTSFTKDDLDLTDDKQIYGCQAFLSHDFVVNCAAYTAVDLAETHVAEAEVINCFAPLAISAMIADSATRLVQISTDFVFDGRKGKPYIESDPTSPIGRYGSSKRDGEEFVMNTAPDSLVVRTSWLYGPNGKSFPKTMIRAWEDGKNLRVVGDQRGNPTYTGDLSKSLVEMMESDILPGIYHATGPDTMAWNEFAKLAIEHWRLPEDNRPIAITPIRTEDWPTPAKRPAFSALSNQKLHNAGITPMRPTTEALREFAFRRRNLES